MFDLQSIIYYIAMYYVKYTKNACINYIRIIILLHKFWNGISLLPACFCKSATATKIVLYIIATKIAQLYSLMEIQRVIQLLLCNALEQSFQ